SPPGARRMASEPAGSALVSASIRISLEKAHGWPARTRRSSPARNRTLGSFAGTLLSFGDSIAPPIGAALPAIAHAADGCQAAFMLADLYSLAGRAQAVGLGREGRHVLELGRAVHVDDPRQVDRLLRRQIPVEHADQRLQGVADDARAAGRAQRRHQL